MKWTPAILVLGLTTGLGCSPSAQHEQEGAPRPLDSSDLEQLVPMKLPADPVEALAALQNASKTTPVVVFKHSPICPISAGAQDRFQGWMAVEGLEGKVQFAHIDVLAEKPLARGLVAELGIKHESPQVLVFEKGEMIWHASHDAITGEALSEQLK